MRNHVWTNPSVVHFAQGEDPVEKIERQARELALQAKDEGWAGPPFDSLYLAEWRGLILDARGDIPDARLVPSASGPAVLQYNPMRPRGRLRFSIAHEIAHTLFPDYAEEVRNRGTDSSVARSDNWQLEVLCNIGAAELLMPLGSFSELAGEVASIQKVMDMRKNFDVSVEACIIRLIKLSKKPMAAFCASVHPDGRHHVDYVIPSHGWTSPVKAGQIIPSDSVIKDAVAIGFTVVGDETWADGVSLRVAKQAGLRLYVMTEGRIEKQKRILELHGLLASFEGVWELPRSGASLTASSADLLEAESSWSGTNPIATSCPRKPHRVFDGPHPWPLQAVMANAGGTREGRPYGGQLP